MPGLSREVRLGNPGVVFGTHFGPGLWALLCPKHRLRSFWAYKIFVFLQVFRISLKKHVKFIILSFVFLIIKESSL